MVEEAGAGVILRQPESIVGEPVQLVGQITQVLVKVDHRVVARLPDHITEGPGAACDGLRLHAVRPGGVPGNELPVKGHGVGHIVPLNGVQDVLRLLLRLPDADGLGEKIDPHLQASVQRPPEVLLKILVRHDDPLGVSPVPQPDHGKFHSRIRYLLPVDLPLISGHIDADGRLLSILLIGEPAPIIDGEAV